MVNPFGNARFGVLRASQSFFRLLRAPLCLGVRLDLASGRLLNIRFAANFP